MNKMQKHLLKAGGALTLLLATACSDGEKPYVEKPAVDLYMKGYKDMVKNDYKDAAESFDEVERQHPYSEWATRGQLMSAYANYLNGDYDKGIATLDAFV